MENYRNIINGEQRNVSAQPSQPSPALTTLAQIKQLILSGEKLCCQSDLDTRLTLLMRDANTWRRVTRHLALPPAQPSICCAVKRCKDVWWVRCAGGAALATISRSIMIMTPFHPNLLLPRPRLAQLNLPPSDGRLAAGCHTAQAAVARFILHDLVLCTLAAPHPST